MGPSCYPIYPKDGVEVKDRMPSSLVTSGDVTNSGSIKTVELSFGSIHVKSLRS